MNRLVPLLSLLAFSPLAAAPADAVRIRQSYQSAVDKWTLEMRIAATPADRAKALAARPDPAPFAREMWKTLVGSLNQEWTLEPAAWFLRLTPSLMATDEAGVAHPIFAKENEAIRTAIETYHLKSPKLAPVCSALASIPSPRSLALLEKIQSTHPDKKIQGVAAFGASLQLKTLGDGPDIIARRLNYLRKAIIQSSDVELDGVTVAKLAEDELYAIRYLAKGRVAPDLVGTDSGNRPMTLASHQGKIIVLTFWNSNLEESQRIVDLTTALQQKYKGEPVVVLGVNNDAAEKLRTLEGNGTVPWKSFTDADNKLANEYRVAVRPLVYVLDGERKIQYIGAPGSFVEFTVEALLHPAGPDAAAKPGSAAPAPAPRR